MPGSGGALPTELGFLVGNHHIRRAAFEAVGVDSPACAVCGPGLCRPWPPMTTWPASRWPTAVLTAELLVAADSRHSSTRRALGSGADMHDFVAACWCAP